MRGLGNWTLVLSSTLLLSGCLLRGSPPLVKIGLVAPFEGEYRRLGYDALNGARLAVRERNAEGGVSGHRVELVALNEFGEPDEARQQAAELARDPLVMGAMGHLRGETTQAAVPVYVRTGLALVALGAPSLGGARDTEGVVRLGPAEEEILLAMLGHAAGAQIRRVAVAGIGAEMGGPDPVAPGPELVPFDGAGPLFDAVSGEPGRWDGILFMGSDVAGTQLIRGLRNAGWNGTFLGGPDLDSPLVAGWTDAGASEILVFDGSYLVTEPDFTAAIRELSGGHPGPWSGPAHDAAGLLLEALEAAIRQDGAPSRSGVREALTRVELDGITGRIAIDESGARVSAPIAVYRFVGSYPGQPLSTSSPAAELQGAGG